MSGLFESLPVFPPALPDEELRFLHDFPDWPVEQEVDDADHPVCRRLEKRGLVKVSRQKMDDIAIRPTWFAGVLKDGRIRGVP